MCRRNCMYGKQKCDTRPGRRETSFLFPSGREQTWWMAQTAHRTLHNGPAILQVDGTHGLWINQSVPWPSTVAFGTSSKICQTNLNSKAHASDLASSWSWKFLVPTRVKDTLYAILAVWRTLLPATAMPSILPVEGHCWLQWEGFPNFAGSFG